MSPTGHLAIGFAAKKYTQDISLPILLIAAYSIDLLYFIFIGLKMETMLLILGHTVLGWLFYGLVLVHLSFISLDTIKNKP